MPSIGPGVEELRVWDESGTYRVVYTARFQETVFVLHAFQKKTEQTAQSDIDRAKSRYKQIKEGQMENVETFSTAWDALADTPAEAANLQARAELMLSITKIIRDNGWKQAEAAEHCGVTQPRVNDLLRGRVSRFSLDALVNIISALGRRVRFDIVELKAA